MATIHRFLFFYIYIFVPCILILEHLISITVLTKTHKHLCPKPYYPIPITPFYCYGKNVLFVRDILKYELPEH